MSTPQTITTSCGCKGTWNPLEGQYNVQHTCDPKVRWAEERALRLRFAEESAKRNNAPLYRRPFSLLK